LHEKKTLATHTWTTIFNTFFFFALCSLLLSKRQLNSPLPSTRLFTSRWRSFLQCTSAVKSELWTNETSPIRELVQLALV